MVVRGKGKESVIVLELQQDNILFGFPPLGSGNCTKLWLIYV